MTMLSTGAYCQTLSSKVLEDQMWFEVHKFLACLFEKSKITFVSLCILYAKWMVLRTNSAWVNFLNFFIYLCTLLLLTIGQWNDNCDSNAYQSVDWLTLMSKCNLEVHIHLAKRLHHHRFVPLFTSMQFVSTSCDVVQLCLKFHQCGFYWNMLLLNNMLVSVVIGKSFQIGWLYWLVKSSTY